MTRPRDSQKQKVYRSERESLDKIPNQEKNEKIGFWEAYCKKLIQSAWFVKRWPNCRTILIKDGRGRRIACASVGYNGGTLKLPKWARQEWVVLHEVAHVITTKTVASHGQEFCANMLELVGHCMGDEAERSLKESFDKNNVKWRKKKEISPERRAQLVEQGKRMAAVLGEKRKTAILA